MNENVIQFRKDLLARNVVDLNLSVRVSNCLANCGIKTIGQLIRHPGHGKYRFNEGYYRDSHEEQPLIHMRNFGRKAIMEIEFALSSLGLSLAPSSIPKTTRRIRMTNCPSCKQWFQSNKGVEKTIECKMVPTVEDSNS